MSRYEFWLHGTSVQVEYPGRVQYIRRAGYYTDVRQDSGTENWFNFPIVTPTLHAGKKMRHSEAYLHVDVLANAKLDRVHIWDGDRCVKKFDDLGLTRQNVERTFSIPKHVVRHGLLISVHVEFLKGEEQGQVHFVGAGASFEED